MKKPMSLTLRLLLCVSALNIVTMIIMALLTLRSANINIAEDYDAQLITEASILWEILEEDSHDGKMAAFNVESFDVEDTEHLLARVEQDSMLDYAQWRAFRVWYDGKIVMHSDNTDILPAASLHSGLSSLTIGKDKWNAFSLHDEQNKLIVETFENLHNRAIIQRDILLDILAPLVIMLPILALIFTFGVSFGLKGLRRLAGKLAIRSPSDLSLLESNDLPKELTPLSNSINSLLSKLQSSIAHEREFIDHAAHELRTPLAALKLQAQMLAKSIHAPDSTDSLRELLASVDRTAKLVDQLMLISRVAQQNITLERVNLNDAVQEVVSMYATRILDKNISLDMRCDEVLTIEAQPELLRTLIGTVIDNAIKYTPHNGTIAIASQRTQENMTITITDSGEGIPESERERVFDRFYRVAGSKQSGSGLGLAIANQIAPLLNATISLETPENRKGLRVAIRFTGSHK